MARQFKRLSARAVATLTAPGKHADGDGLYLIVDPSGAKRWAFLFRRAGKLREMGLGGLAGVSLVEAREKAAEARRLLAAGKNPIDERRAARAALSEAPTFGPFADALAAELANGYRNEEHKAQWRRTLSVFAAPLRSKRLDEIQTDDVLAVLSPIWNTKPETASRVRGRIERVLDAAKAKGLRSGENPARWRGHLENLLSSRRKITRSHHAALPYPEVPAFVAELRSRNSVAALALEFTILTAARSGEVIGARWSEIDHDANVWTVPAERMKAGSPHRVPLTTRTLAILVAAEAVRAGEFIFPGRRPDRHVSRSAFKLAMERMGVGAATIHGFRSSFRDWAGECTAFPREVAEAALAHAVGDQVERAYRRGDALEKRRTLLEAWASFTANSADVSGTVVPIRRGSST